MACPSASLASFLVASAAVLGLTVACGTSNDAVGTGVDDVASETPIAPADWLACYVKADEAAADPFFASHELHCAPRVPADYPLQPERFTVEYRTVDQKGGWKDVFPTDGDVVVGGLRDDAFPVTLHVRTSFGRAVVENVGVPSVLRQAVTFDALATATPDAPKVLTQPFALWAIDLENRAGDFMSLDVRDHVVDVSPWLDRANFEIPDTGKSQLTLRPKGAFTRVDGEVLAMLVVAPEDGAKLPARLMTAGGGDHEVVITGPGRWRATATGLERRAGAASEDASALVDEASTEDASVPVGDASVEAGPERIGPDCGNASETCCAGRGCTAGAYCDFRNTCQACGLAGQTCCPGTACATGSFCDFRNTCAVCGETGQTCCPGQKCADGNAYCDFRNSCAACGGAGQTCCPGKTCGDGLACDFRNQCAPR